MSVCLLYSRDAVSPSVYPARRAKIRLAVETMTAGVRYVQSLKYLSLVFFANLTAISENVLQLVCS